MTIKLRASGWELGGKHLPWIWGQINYWDLERSRWRDVLRAYHERGNAVLSAAVLPRVHRTDSGGYDFGAAQPQNDLPAFLSEAHQLGLKVVLWTGPRSTPGVAAAGYPDDLLASEDALARDASGNPIVSAPGFGGEVFCLPSLVCEPLQRMLESFSRELGQVLAPFLHPDGPVIGLGLTLAPGWSPALSAFAADYHPAAKTAYREWLKKRYRRIQALNQAHGSNCAAFEEAEPPCSAGEAPDFHGPRLQDWARSREEYFVRAAEMLHGAFSPLAQERVPIFLAALPRVGRPGNPAELERSRCFAYVMPEAPPVFSRTGDEEAFFFSLAGQNRYSAWFQARPELSADDESGKEYRLLGQMAAGLRAWDALAPSGSGGIPGFLTDRLGASCRAYAAFWESLREQSRTEGFLQSQFYSDVVLLTVPELERAKYLQTPAAPRYDLLDLQCPPPRPAPEPDPRTSAYEQRRAQLEHFLREGQYAYVQAEGDGPADRFTDSQLLILPSEEALPAPLQAQIAEWLDKGINIVLAGPLPAHPEQASHAPLGELAAAKSKSGKGGGKNAKNAKKAGRLHHLPELNEAKFTRLLQVIGVTRELTFDCPGVKLTFHRFRNRIFVAAFNPGEEALEATARREGKFVMKDFWNAKKFIGGNQEIKLTLPPRSVKFWELIPC